MASEKNVNIQDVFLNHVRKSRTPLSIFLINGVKLQGVLMWFDQHSMLIKRDGSVQLVYKHAVSTLIPHGPFPFLDYRTGHEQQPSAGPVEEVTPQNPVT